MTDPLDTLSRLAQAATPGPWRITKTHDLWAQIDAGHGLDRTMVADCVYDRNANLIAACSPDVILALIARARLADRLAEASDKLIAAFDQVGHDKETCMACRIEHLIDELRELRAEYDAAKGKA